MNQVILNSGDGAWAFQDLAESLADSLKVEVRNVPGDFNYVLRGCLRSHFLHNVVLNFAPLAPKFGGD